MSVELGLGVGVAVFDAAVHVCVCVPRMNKCTQLNMLFCQCVQCTHYLLCVLSL